MRITLLAKLAVITLMAACLGTVEAVELPLVTAGASKYSIVTPDQPTEREQFAAAELQKYLELISGAKLAVQTESKTDGPKIVVAVASRTKAAAKIAFAKGDADYDAFAIETSGNDLLLIGSNERAVIYAVYTLLADHLGCRWPVTELQKKKGDAAEPQEIIPKKAIVTVPELRERHKASMKWRGLISAPWFGDFRPEVVDWMTKNRLNYMFVAYPGGYEESQSWRTNIAIGEMWKKRGMVIAAGHHSFDFFVPPKEYFATHPEYYALIGGQRKPAGRGVQLCLSNPELADIYVKNVVAFAKRHPEVGVLALYPNDGDGWCECDKCKKAMPSSWAANTNCPNATELCQQFMNKVVPAIKAQVPDRIIERAAYINYGPLPETTKPIAGMNVIYANYERPWYRQSLDTPGANPYVQKNIEAWGKEMKDKGDFLIYEYYNGGVFCHWQGFALVELIAKEMAYYRRMGVSGCLVPYFWKHRAECAINTYAFARSAWDTTVSPETILNDYCKAHYGGKAAPAMVKYYKEFESNCREHLKYFGRDQASENLCKQYLTEAKALADSEAVKKALDVEQGLLDKYLQWQGAK
ncbi:MAG: DUF4838 domain-containing protein [Verrucomicrobia bacterium]|nr:DUF4838 domain-containing protein [Verrucomicrobiota bacterium]MBU4290726.1 DUF4838 domain-containing protein [Verrucomicrobiota bacterium]MBU4428413.1 DUF4838 domain-containing protein [Verrucomicrobiota bacterium]MCG2680005.1 DUF4838 domain-containing protein [Kiritimatiellia bacterium]